VNVPSLVLNAHPACDRSTQQCYVQHPCPKSSSPLSDQACISLLTTPEDGNDRGLNTTILSRITLPKAKIIQHSHSPFVTPHYVISKLDAFTPRSPLNLHGGLLKYLHQGEDSAWMVMDRRSNTSRLMQSTASAALGGGAFVNNHFWNCFEDAATGDIVVEAVAATEDYLDSYFERSLDKPTDWAKIFHPPIRCRIPSATSTNSTAILCTPLLTGANASLPFDYPTFNPLFKMDADYRFYYGIAPSNTSSSRWFDLAVKVDAKAGRVERSWSSPGVYLTEFDFVPRTNSTSPEDEDDGVLLTVLYNTTSDTSTFGVFDAKTLNPVASYDMGGVVPFHAHGISCRRGEACFTNP